MRVWRVLMTGVLMVIPGVLWALNPIHEAGYALWNRGVPQADFRVEGGVLFKSGNDNVEIPLGMSLPVTHSLELGLGLKTVWGSGANHVPYVPFGLKYQLHGATVLNLDFLLATGNSSHGLRLGLTSRTGRRRFSSRLFGNLGFMDGLVDRSALLALEGGWTPALRLGRSLLLESGFVASSQTKAFDDHFALDWQPGILIPYSHDGGILTRITVGLAGNHREDLAIKVAMAQGF